MSNHAESMMQDQMVGAACENEALRKDLLRLRYALGDVEEKLSVSQLTRRAYELSNKAKKWDEWAEAQERIESEMPPGWSFVIQCSPGDWSLSLTDPDGDPIDFKFVWCKC